MRFMMLMIPKGYEKAEADARPSAEAVAAMTRYNESLTRAGVLYLLPSLRGELLFRLGASSPSPPAFTGRVLGVSWYARPLRRSPC